MMGCQADFRDDDTIELKTSHPKTEMEQWEKDAYEKGRKDEREEILKMIDNMIYSYQKADNYDAEVCLIMLKDKIKEGEKE